MAVFGAYSQYYDLLYKDKDYIGEAEYIHDLIQKYNTGASSILDLGCGTGHHAQLLGEKGYQVYGVDLSADMLAVAEKRHTHPNVMFCQGDVTSVRLDKRVDVVTALFHVMSYQVTTEALEAAFETAKEHLNKGGVFIFDCWYGPAVLSQQPETRVKRLENDKIQVTRIAEPKLRENQNTVDVNYNVFVKNKLSEEIIEIKEKHVMRYLFKNEVEQLLISKRMKLIDVFEFMSDKMPSKDTWGVCFVCQKVNE